ncbi:MAG: hypothetical protein C4582_01515 [Desulfobacteraceae bacterium]|jgi:hypothetical protein|nr:MAG: hypothetical protein C4582_01515 [Desulfobacteraceae bacterium]
MELIRTQRRKWSWTDKRTLQGNAVIEVANDLVDYWPLTLRQIYYRLVAAGHIENTRSKYKDLSKLIKHMRLSDWLPWEVLEDRGRHVTDKKGFTDHQEFLTEQVDGFLEGYSRCLVQDQPAYVELWYEKDALARVFDDVVWPYCIRSVACKGYQSITFLDSFRRRALEAQKRGQIPVILYFGDCDPSGIQMFQATQQTLREEMNLANIQCKRIALTPEQVNLFNLPVDPGAVKLTDSRYKKYVSQYGHLAVELDALHPGKLIELAEQAIQAEFDMTLFNENKIIEKEERQRLTQIKERLVANL